MLKKRRAPKLVAALAVLSLTAAACGSGGSDSDAIIDTAPAGVNETADLPPVDTDDLPESDGQPTVAGACAPGEPDCLDTLVGEPEVSDLPSNDGEKSTGDLRIDTNSLMIEEGPVEDTAGVVNSSGFVLDGGLTIPELLTTDATGVVAVKGHLFGDQTGLRLCESLVGGGERYACGGESIVLVDFDLESVGVPVIPHEGITYTEELVTVFGESDNGSLIVENFVG